MNPSTNCAEKLWEIFILHVKHNILFAVRCVFCPCIYVHTALYVCIWWWCYYCCCCCCYYCCDCCFNDVLVVVILAFCLLIILVISNFFFSRFYRYVCSFCAILKNKPNIVGPDCMQLKLGLCCWSMLAMSKRLNSSSIFAK